MNFLWAGMILIGVVYAAFNGTLPDVTTAALNSAKEAVTLCIATLGVLSFWMGLMNIAERGGMIAGITRMLKPILHYLFPNIPKDHIANEYLSMNIVANVFGLGWAATPAGLKAMAELQKLNEENCRIKGENKYRGIDIATKEMCDFLIINISSLQIVPVTIIAYRAEYGSVNPTDVMGPALAATTIGTVVAIIFCKMMHNKGEA